MPKERFLQFVDERLAARQPFRADGEEPIVTLTRDERDIVRGLLLRVRQPRQRPRMWTVEEERLLEKLQATP